MQCTSTQLSRFRFQAARSLNQALLLLIDAVVLVIQNRVVANDPLGRLLCALTLNVSCPCACAAEQDGNQGAFDAPGVQWQFTLL
jgi:hypothetical protein